MAKPFLKWPGGKRWLTPYVYNLLKERKFDRYFEPFLGGGAVFFSLHPKAATLSDVNADLVNTYHQVKERPLELIEKLKEIPVDKTYLTLREASPINPVDRAIRFLYLNRTAFGGMYRLDREGRSMFLSGVDKGLQSFFGGIIFLSVHLKCSRGH